MKVYPLRRDEISPKAVRGSERNDEISRIPLLFVFALFIVLLLLHVMQ
jgi:hypothetical protein